MWQGTYPDDNQTGLPPHRKTTLAPRADGLLSRTLQPNNRLGTKPVIHMRM